MPPQKRGPHPPFLSTGQKKCEGSVAQEIRALRRWLRRRIKVPCSNSPLVFLSESGPMTRQAFNYICAEIGKRAGLNIKVHPHMLRHSCGFALANEERDTRLIQNYLGHRNITHTQIYTRDHRGIHQSSSTLLFLRNGNVTIA